jgi:hypothetical protein
MHCHLKPPLGTARADSDEAEPVGVEEPVDEAA